jgi:hypothetical protein
MDGVASLVDRCERRSVAIDADGDDIDRLGRPGSGPISRA